MNTSQPPQRSILIHSREGGFFFPLLPAKSGAGGARGGLGRDGWRRNTRERLERGDDVNEAEEGERKGGGLLAPLPDDSLPIAAARRRP
jgi:hypothetical protein